MNLRKGLLLALTFVSLVGAAEAKEPKLVSFPATRSDPSLVGKKIRLDACIAIPLSANPQESDDAVILYPCGHKLDESLIEVVIIGKITPREVVKPFADAGISFTGEVRATFLGTLEKIEEGTDGSVAYYVLNIERVANPSETPESES